jgi:SAM-dependent methyltransferase
MTKYREIYKHYEECFNSYGDNHRGMDWPNYDDAQLRYSVMADLVKYSAQKFDSPRILDFGCGAGHFYEFIKSKGLNYQYSGCDISNQFVDFCSKKFPSINFFVTDVVAGEPIIGEYDFLVLNGVFTEKQSLSNDEMWSFCRNLISRVCGYAKVGLAINFMSKNVDWERDDLFHLSFDTLTNFISTEISRNFVIRSDYGLYDYTIYIYK